MSHTIYKPFKKKQQLTKFRHWFTINYEMTRWCKTIKKKKYFKSILVDSLHLVKNKKDKSNVKYLNIYKLTFYYWLTHKNFHDAYVTQPLFLSHFWDLTYNKVTKIRDAPHQNRTPFTPTQNWDYLLIK